jgi:hypothetical protein
LSDDGQFLVLPVAAPAVCDWRLVADVPVTTALRVRSNSPDDPTAESGGYSLPMNDQFAALRGEADGAVRLGGRLSRYRPRRRASVCFWSRPSLRVGPQEQPKDDHDRDRRHDSEDDSGSDPTRVHSCGRPYDHIVVQMEAGLGSVERKPIVQPTAIGVAQILVATSLFPQKTTRTRVSRARRRRRWGWREVRIVRDAHPRSQAVLTPAHPELGACSHPAG